MLCCLYLPLASLAIDLPLDLEQIAIDCFSFFLFLKISRFTFTCNSKPFQLANREECCAFLQPEVIRGHLENFNA